MGLVSEIRKNPIPDPRSRGQIGIGSRIRIRNTATGNTPVWILTPHRWDTHVASSNCAQISLRLFLFFLYEHNPDPCSQSLHWLNFPYLFWGLLAAFVCCIAFPTASNNQYKEAPGNFRDLHRMGDRRNSFAKNLRASPFIKNATFRQFRFPRQLVKKVEFKSVNTKTCLLTCLLTVLTVLYLLKGRPGSLYLKLYEQDCALFILFLYLQNNHVVLIFFTHISSIKFEATRFLEELKF